MKRRDFIKRSSLGALTAWAGSSLLLIACHTEEDMIGEPNWIVEGSFDRLLTQPPTSSAGAVLNAQFTTDMKEGWAATRSMGGLLKWSV